MLTDVPTIGGAVSSGLQASTGMVIIGGSGSTAVASQARSRRVTSHEGAQPPPAWL
jgi:hypothetical protein